MVHPVGKTIPEVHKAYLAGFIDGDGAIMALLERHPAKRFGFRIRVWVKATQLRQLDVAWLAEELGIGQVRRSRECWEWLVKNQSDVRWLLQAIPTICSRESAADRDCVANSGTQNRFHR